MLSKVKVSFWSLACRLKNTRTSEHKSWLVLPSPDQAGWNAQLTTAVFTAQPFKSSTSTPGTDLSYPLWWFTQEPTQPGQQDCDQCRYPSLMPCSQRWQCQQTPQVHSAEEQRQRPQHCGQREQPQDSRGWERGGHHLVQGFQEQPVAPVGRKDDHRREHWSNYFRSISLYLHDSSWQKIYLPILKSEKLLQYWVTCWSTI